MQLRVENNRICLHRIYGYLVKKMRLACYCFMCNHFISYHGVKTKITTVRPGSVSWMLLRCCSLCFFYTAPICDGCVTLVKDCKCSNEKLKQNQSTVLDSYARVIKLVIYFAL